MFYDYWGWSRQKLIEHAQTLSDDLRKLRGQIIRELDAKYNVEAEKRINQAFVDGRARGVKDMSDFYLSRVETELNALRKENTRLLSQVIPLHKELADWRLAYGDANAQRTSYREALEKIAHLMEEPKDNYGKSIGCQECGGTEIAKAALAEGDSHKAKEAI